MSFPFSVVLALFVGVFALTTRAYHKTPREIGIGARASSVPSSLPFGIGVLIQMLGHLRNNTILPWMQQILNNPGRTVELHMLGRSMVMTDNIENIRAIMSTQYECFGKGEVYHKIWSSLMRDSILSTDGHAWQINRGYLQAHAGKIRPTDIAVTEQHVQNLIAILSDGKPHDTLDQLNRLAIDVVSDIFYGTSTNTLLTNDQSLRNAIQRHKNTNQVRNIFGKIGAMLPSDRWAVNIIDKYLTDVIRSFSLETADSLEDRDRRSRSLLGVLSSQHVTDDVLKNQLVAVLVGGRDSLAIAVTWMLYELVRHPHVQDKLRDEIRSILGSVQPPNASSLEKMPFLSAVVNETMRVHASVGINTRTALKDTTFPSGGGPLGKSPIVIPAGTTVVMASDSVHRRKDIYGDDADEFKPHRWDNNWKPDTWTYLPFNRGPRTCLGKTFSLMEVKYILCRVLQAFSKMEYMQRSGESFAVIEADRIPGMKTKMAFNTKPANTVWLSFTR